MHDHTSIVCGSSSVNTVNGDGAQTMGTNAQLSIEVLANSRLHSGMFGVHLPLLWQIRSLGPTKRYPALQECSALCPAVVPPYMVQPFPGAPGFPQFLPL